MTRTVLALRSAAQTCVVYGAVWRLDSLMVPLPSLTARVEEVGLGQEAGMGA